MRIYILFMIIDQLPTICTANVCLRAQLPFTRALEVGGPRLGSPNHRQLVHGANKRALLPVCVCVCVRGAVTRPQRSNRRSDVESIITRLHLRSRFNKKVIKLAFIFLWFKYSTACFFILFVYLFCIFVELCFLLHHFLQCIVLFLLFFNC